MTESNPCSAENRSDVVLIGAGVVGASIAEAHRDAEIPFTIADIRPGAAESVARGLGLDGVPVSVGPLGGFATTGAAVTTDALVIESVPEDRDVKREFARGVLTTMPGAVWASNTSTLSIRSLADDSDRPDRVVGMHFFMPVPHRWGVELVTTDQTSTAVARRCRSHIERLNRTIIPAPDTPGFIVNRMLAPYLNESLSLLTAGVSPEVLRNAATDYGMPISPLELIDHIGMKTMFDSGRIYWQNWPRRMNPSPVVARAIKLGRHGPAVRVLDERGGLTETMRSLVKRYRTDDALMTTTDVMRRMSAVMADEARQLIAEGGVSVGTIDAAMRGGLGFGPGPWSERVEFWGRGQGLGEKEKDKDND